MPDAFGSVGAAVGSFVVDAEFGDDVGENDGGTVDGTAVRLPAHATRLTRLSPGKHSQ
jgi:hypothetical protein